MKKHQSKQPSSSFFLCACLFTVFFSNLVPAMSFCALQNTHPRQVCGDCMDQQRDMNYLCLINKETCLHRAMRNNHPECARRLLDAARAGIFTVANQASSLFHNMPVLVACANKAEASLSVLVGAAYKDIVTIDDLNERGNTALHVAALADSDACVAALLASHFQAVNVQNSHGWTALHYAVEGDSEDDIAIVRMLVASAKFTAQDATDNCGWTALHDAVRNTFVDIVQALLYKPEPEGGWPDGTPDEDKVTRVDPNAQIVAR